MKRYRLTILFAITAVVVIAVATAVVYRVIGDLTEENLIRIGEENTDRDAMHIQSMMRAMEPIEEQHSMNDTPATGAMEHGTGMQHPQSAAPMTLESLASPEGLPSNYPHLVEGLNIVKVNLFDLNGFVVWSTDVANLDVTKRKRNDSIYWEAVRGETASKFVRGEKIIGFNGVQSTFDVVESYIPLRDTPSGQLIGVLELYRMLPAM